MLLARRLRFSAPARLFAAAASPGGKKSSGGPPQSASSSDARLDALKQMLYATPSHSSVVAEASPAGDDSSISADCTAREAEYHETIRRAYTLHTRQQDAEYVGDLQRKLNNMNAAHNALRDLDERLYEGAVWREHGRVYPRRWRVPTETLPEPGKVWRYEAIVNDDPIKTGA